MKIEMEIPDPPEGWVVDGFREAYVNEIIWRGDGWVFSRINTLGKYLVCVKAKPLWEPSPALLSLVVPGWVTRDKDGYCRHNNDQAWYSDEMHSLMAIQYDMLPPKDIPWDQCCFKIGEPQE